MILYLNILYEDRIPYLVKSFSNRKDAIEAFNTLVNGDFEIKHYHVFDLGITQDLQESFPTANLDLTNSGLDYYSKVK